MTLPEPHSRVRRRSPASRRALPVVLGVLLVAAPLLPFTPPAAGQQSNQSRLEKIRAELRDAKTDADKNQKLLDEIEGQIKLVERKLRAARDEEKAGAVERKQADTLALAADAEVDRLRRQIGERARTVYMTGGTGQLEALTGSDSPEAMLDRVLRLDSLAREDSRIMPDLQTALEIAQGAQERIRLADEHRAAATAAINQQGAELRETRTVRAEAQKRLETRIRQYQEAIEVVLQESARLRAELSGSSGSGSVGNLLRPVPCPQTSGFGYRWGRMHEGIDFGCDIGTPVKAAKAGLVIKAGWSSGYGNLVLVDHGDGVVTAYAHNSRFAAGVGDDVNAGQVVAYSGNTGRSTGPHVHFEVRINGVPKNPALYL
jgi:murein DD-endopeptidase MepM/ murein hydrolase activator NlpD